MSEDFKDKEWVDTSIEPVEVGARVFDDENSSLWRRIKGSLTLQVNESRMGGGKWSNGDLDPVESEYQTWRTYNCKSFL